MRARMILETEKWEKLPLPTGAVRDGANALSMISAVPNDLVLELSKVCSHE